MTSVVAAGGVAGAVPVWAQLVDLFTQIAVVPQSNGIALTALDRADQIHSTESCLDDLIDHRSTHAITRRCIAIDREFNVGLAKHDVWIDRAGVDEG